MRRLERLLPADPRRPMRSRGHSSCTSVDQFSLGSSRLNSGRSDRSKLTPAGSRVLQP